jgi:hypothetical protein
VEEGWNIPTVAVRVVRGDKKGIQCPGEHLRHPSPLGYKYGDLALQVGGISSIGTNKYGLKSRGTQTPPWLRWREPAATVNYRPVLSSESGYKITNPQLTKENTTEKEKLVAGPRMCLTPRRTDRLTVGRNLTLTSTAFRLPDSKL